MKKKSGNHSAFFNLRVLLGVVLCATAATLAFVAFRPASAQSKPQPPPIMSGTYKGLLQVAHFDVSPPLREMKIIPPGPGQLRENEDADALPSIPNNTIHEPDPVVQSKVGVIDIPAPMVSFDGQPNTSGVAPPDSNGAVGPNHVVTMCNLSFQIFNKTGTSLFGPAQNNTLWSGFGGPCQTSNSGDPVVLYDKQANRWLLSQFTAGAAPFYNCVAISQTSDPTGAYYRYAIITGTTGANFPDYPKYGVWPDAYYLSTREFLGSGGPFQGIGAYALNRAQMLAGNPNPQVIFFLASPTPMYNVGDGLLPSDLDGMTPPPVGSPNYFLGTMDNNGPYGAPQDAVNLWKFHADFAVPANSTFTLTNTIPTAPFNSVLALCGGTRACIPQPSTTNKIDHLGVRQRPLFRAAYRNFGDHESLVSNNSVSAGNGPNGEVSGIRWFELRSPNSSPVIYQQGTYAPGLTDGIHRWMGSVAMDGQGNMAMGYSAANASVFPSMYYTGRNAGNPLGTMPLGEGSIINGTGSQTAGGNRWGDYSSLTVDPTDDATFWFVSEYVPTTSGSGWRLRIGSFKLGAPTVVSAVSRKNHNGVNFDVPLPAPGTVGIEDRRGSGVNFDGHQVIITFAVPVTVSGVTVASSNGLATATQSVSGATVTVNLSTVADAQSITITLMNVNDGTNTSNISIPMGVLLGDTNADRFVNSGDALQTRSRSGQATDATNFRSDVNVDGFVNSGDTTIVRGKAGNFLP